MKLSAFIAAAAIGTGSLASMNAEAKPFIYVDNYTYSGTTEQCLKNAKGVLDKHNFDLGNTDTSLQKD